MSYMHVQLLVHVFPINTILTLKYKPAYTCTRISTSTCSHNDNNYASTLVRSMILIPGGGGGGGAEFNQIPITKIHVVSSSLKIIIMINFVPPFLYYQKIVYKAYVHYN